jgi:pimeloyl-ACP methyl ester carboxylesterase
MSRIKLTFTLIFYWLIICLNLAKGQESTPYIEDTILIERNGSKIYGSQLLPPDNHFKTVVLIIAGSGPTDRNGNNPMMTNNSLKMLAESLVIHEIASVRYDKRGVGASLMAGASEIDLRFEDYVADASRWIQNLNKKFDQVVVIGHSEGSLIGMLAVQKAETSGFISIAGPGESADLVLKRQLNAQPQFIKDQLFPMIDSLKNGYTVNKVDPSYYSLFRPSVQPYLISWFKYDPQAEIKKIDLPVLIIQGSTDIQVREEDAELLKKAAPEARVEIIEGMNHIFKPSTNNRQENIATYSNPDLAINEGLVNIIVEFVSNLY